MGTDKQGKTVVHDTDEGIRPNTNMASLAKLPDIKSRGKNEGLITAGLASQICDGAAAILICNARGLKKLGVQPRARIRALAVAGDDPGKKQRSQPITIHSTILEDRYKRLVKTDSLFFFYLQS